MRYILSSQKHKTFYETLRRRNTMEKMASMLREDLLVQPRSWVVLLDGRIWSLQSYSFMKLMHCGALL